METITAALKDKRVNERKRLAMLSSGGKTSTLGKLYRRRESVNRIIKEAVGGDPRQPPTPHTAITLRCLTH